MLASILFAVAAASLIGLLVGARGRGCTARRRRGRRLRRHAVAADGDAARRDLARRATARRRARRAASAACGRRGRPRAWRSARRCSPSCSPLTGYVESTGSAVVAQPGAAVVGIIVALQPAARGARAAQPGAARAVPAAAGRHRGGCRGRGGRAGDRRSAGIRPTSSPSSGRLRAGDAPTHGGRVLSYVYDSGEAELDELAAAAARLVQPVNGLDPTTFTSVAAMESGARRLRAPGVPRRRRRGRRRGGHGHVGRHRELPARGEDRARRLAIGPRRHAARAAPGRAGHRARRVPQGGRVLRPRARPRAGRSGHRNHVPGGDRGAARRRRRARRGERALVPVRDPRPRRRRRRRLRVARASPCTSTRASAASRSRSGPTSCPRWDLAVPGVTSLSADLHKYGYAPKGVSVLLHPRARPPAPPVLRHDRAGPDTPSSTRR